MVSTIHPTHLSIRTLTPCSLVNSQTATETLPEHQNIFTGDFNLHVSDVNDNDSAIFIDTIEAMGLIQHVGAPTHKSGNTLDLMISEIQGNTTIKTVNTGPYISDHCMVIATLKAKRDPPTTKVRLIRGTHRITDEQWCDEFNPSKVHLTTNLEESMQSLNTELTRVLNTLAPEKEKRISLKTKRLWYDQEMKELKRKVRRLEKEWLRYKLDSCWMAYKKAQNSYYYKLNAKKKDTIRAKINDCTNDSTKVHKLINNLTKPREEQPWPEHKDDKSLANKFTSYFEDKILKIRKVLETTPPYTAEQQAVPRLTRLAPMTEEEVHKVIVSLKTKSCELDTMPTDILKKMMPVVLPLITKIINLSLTQGDLYRSWKTAVV